MNLTFDKKKCILLATWLLIGILSFTVVGKYAAAPESHQATITSLDEKSAGTDHGCYSNFCSDHPSAW